MGQQHRKVVKRRRRTSYLARKKAQAKEKVSTRREAAPKARSVKKTATAAAE